MTEALHYNGLLIINKPKGMTSHTVVSRVRRLLNMKRVGHAGTLDPLATGVLVVMVGPATRLSQFLIEKNKHYAATLHLGISTSTYDAEGEITAQRPVEGITLDAIQQASATYSGPIKQVPPMYSAIKINGQKLYKLARQGKEIERPARPVTIHQLTITRWESPELDIDVLCSAGTYIRSLAYDIGETLGCGAHLSALKRTASGQFSLEQSYSLEQLADMQTNGTLAQAILPPTTAVKGFPQLILDTNQVTAVRYGQIIEFEGASAPFIAGLDAEGDLVTILTPNENQAGTLHPKIVFPPIER